MPKLNNIKNVPAWAWAGHRADSQCSSSSLFELLLRTAWSWAPHSLAFFRKALPGPEGDWLPLHSSGPSPCNAASLNTSFGMDCLIHLFIWQLFPVMPAGAQGFGNKDPDPFSYSGQLWRAAPASKLSWACWALYSDCIIAHPLLCLLLCLSLPPTPRWCPWALFYNFLHVSLIPESASWAWPSAWSSLESGLRRTCGKILALACSGWVTLSKLFNLSKFHFSFGEKYYI